ncbi:hypothetical protein CIRMBP1304_01577 [Enterococcus cecorum]|nr:hypothetical protein CIRMBP1304_01577 [Enterococcus cecorum]
MMNELKEIFNNTNFEFYGIRGEDDQIYTIGEILEDSYYWNYDEDRTTYGYEDEASLDGVSVIIVKEDMEPSTPYYGFSCEFKDAEGKKMLDKLVEKTLEALEFHKNAYGYDNVYLVGSDEMGSGDAFDDNEYVLANAEVLYKF